MCMQLPHPSQAMDSTTQANHTHRRRRIQHRHNPFRFSRVQCRSTMQRPLPSTIVAICRSAAAKGLSESPETKFLATYAGRPSHARLTCSVTRITSMRWRTSSTCVWTASSLTRGRTRWRNISTRSRTAAIPDASISQRHCDWPLDGRRSTPSATTSSERSLCGSFALPKMGIRLGLKAEHYAITDSKNTTKKTCDDILGSIATLNDLSCSDSWTECHSHMSNHRVKSLWRSSTLC